MPLETVNMSLQRGKRDFADTITLRMYLEMGKSFGVNMTLTVYMLEI